MIIALVSTASLLGLLFYVAIAAVIIWGIYALLQWAGITIPPPVRIIFIVLVSILFIILLFRIFGVLAAPTEHLPFY